MSQTALPFRPMWLTSIVASLVCGAFLFPTNLEAQSEAKGRKFIEIKEDLKTFSRRAVDAENHNDRLHSVMDLCCLYYEIRSDQRYPTSQTLQGYGRRIHFRLNEVKKEIQKEIKKHARQETREPVIVEEPTDEMLYAAAMGISDQMMLMSYTNGGPHHVVDSAGGYFGGIVQANADELIELIENTLHPDFWETNGGVGSLGYWSQSMVLVVRATTQVHEDLERFLNMIKYSY